MRTRISRPWAKSARSTLLLALALPAGPRRRPSAQPPDRSPHPQEAAAQNASVAPAPTSAGQPAGLPARAVAPTVPIPAAQSTPRNLWTDAVETKLQRRCAPSGAAPDGGKRPGPTGLQLFGVYARGRYRRSRRKRAPTGCSTLLPRSHRARGVDPCRDQRFDGERDQLAEVVGCISRALTAEERHPATPTRLPQIRVGCDPAGPLAQGGSRPRAGAR